MTLVIYISFCLSCTLCFLFLFCFLYLLYFIYFTSTFIIIFYRLKTAFPRVDFYLFYNSSILNSISYPTFWFWVTPLWYKIVLTEYYFTTIYHLASGEVVVSSTRSFYYLLNHYSLNLCCFSFLPPPAGCLLTRHSSSCHITEPILNFFALAMFR